MDIRMDTVMVMPMDMAGMVPIRLELRRAEDVSGSMVVRGPTLGGRARPLPSARFCRRYSCHGAGLSIRPPHEEDRRVMRRMIDFALRHLNICHDAQAPVWPTLRPPGVNFKS